MADITGDWNKNMPSGTSRKSDGDDLMRQHWRSLESTLTTEHYFNNSAASAGLHKKGSARVYVQPTYPASSLDRDGKLLFDSAKSRLFVLRDSGRTNLVGGAPLEEAIHFSFESGVTPGVAAQRVVVSIRSDQASAAEKAIYYGIIFDNIPFITVSATTTATLGIATASIQQANNTNFKVNIWDESHTTVSEGVWDAHIVGYVSNMS